MQILKIASPLAEVQQLHYLRNRYTSSIAFIDEENCIGCTKCIDRCPADAIVGAKRQLHTIVRHYCTGCHLCTAVCPTNCISMIEVKQAISPRHAKQRYQTHLQRIHQAKPQATTSPQVATKPVVQQDPRKQAVADAIARAKLKKQQLQNQFPSYESK